MSRHRTLSCGAVDYNSLTILAKLAFNPTFDTCIVLRCSRNRLEVHRSRSTTASDCCGCKSQQIMPPSYTISPYPNYWTTSEEARQYQFNAYIITMRSSTKRNARIWRIHKRNNISESTVPCADRPYPGQARSRSQQVGQRDGRASFVVCRHLIGRQRVSDLAHHQFHLRRTGGVSTCKQRVYQRRRGYACRRCILI